MPRDFEVYLEDIREAIVKIRDYTAGLTRQSFVQDDMRIDAVIRNLEILFTSGFRFTAAGIQVRRRRIAFAFEGRNLDYNLFLTVGNASLLLCRARFPFERRGGIIP